MADAFLLLEDGGYLLQEDGGKLILEYDIDAHLTGVGTLSAILAMEKLLQASLSGDGSVTAALEVTKYLAAAFSGLGSLTGNLTTEKLLASSLSGSGTLTADLLRTAALYSALTGAGAVTALLTVFRLEQEGFRGYEDDADEGLNTPRADQDVNFEVLAGERFLARFLVDNLGDAQTVSFTVQGRKKGSGDPWTAMKYLNPFSSGFDEGSGHG